jgi:ABC-2 type transport system permease protein
MTDIQISFYRAGCHVSVVTKVIVKKYWHVINIGIQNSLTYRVNFLFRVIFGFIPLLATIFLWRAIYAGKTEGASVADYTLIQMTSYYLIVTLVDVFTAVSEDDWQIAADIKDGNISQFLVKPIDYLYYRLCLFFSGRLIYMLVSAVPLGIFIFYMRHLFCGPASAQSFVFFILSMMMTALLQFFLSYSMAMLAFWVQEVSTFIFILYAMEYIASGHLFPLDILPPTLGKILFLTPFPYQMFFPVSIYMGRVTGSALWNGLAIQALWVVATYLLARLAWNRGVRKYSAVGG